MRRSIVLAGFIAVVACSRAPETPIGPGATETTDAAVSAERAGEGIRITNRTTTVIEFYVVNPNWLGLLASCGDDEMKCPEVAAGSSIVVAPRDIYGFTSSVKSLDVVYWAAGNRDGKKIVVAY